MLYRSIVFALLAVQFQIASAENVGSPTCTDAVDPSSFTSGHEKVVIGNSSERLYLYIRRPDTCSSSEGADCKAKAYIVGGDTVSTSKVCGAWIAVKFQGKTRVFYGWVQSDRLQDHLPDQAALESSDWPISKWCLNRRDFYEARLENLKAKESVEELEDGREKGVFIGSFERAPDGFAGHLDLGDDGDAISVAKAQINGNKVKIVAIGSSGMCAGSHLEFWSSDLKKYLGVVDDVLNHKVDSGDHSWIVTIQGKQYILNESYYNRVNDAVAIGFDRNMKPYSACHIVLENRHPEKIIQGEDNKLCVAVRSGQVEEVALDRTEGATHPEKDFGSIPLEFKDGAIYEIFKPTLIDVSNDGHPRLVANARSFGTQGQGCGFFNLDWEWPVVVKSDGFPDTDSALNMLSSSTGNQSSRLIRYRGKIYIESRSLPHEVSSTHTVSALTAHGVETICRFNPIHYVVKPR